MRSFAVLLTLALAAPSAATVVRKSLRPADAPAKPLGDMVAPLRFDQRLLVCNAYPSKSPVVVKKNEKEMLVDEENPIAYKECRYVDSRVEQHDRLDLSLRDVEMHGTFEVGELPNSDAVLLLVLDKRENSPLVGFQSFAFPSRPDAKDAQLAVIDTFKGNSSAPHLKMEDHINEKEKKTVSKRIEQLNFNRVYSVEEGEYEASVADKTRSSKPEDETHLEQETKRSLHLAKSLNYVVLRVGGSSPDFPEGLVVYPETPMGHSGGSRMALSWLAVVAAAVATFMG